MPSLEEQSLNRCGKSDPAYTSWPNFGRTLAIMAITGHNQNASGSDLAYLLGKLTPDHRDELYLPTITSCTWIVFFFIVVVVVCVCVWVLFFVFVL